MNVSRAMSTQHPDNVASPFFSDSEVLAGDAEVREAYFVFSQLNCKEQMWDSEGKDVDDQVVEKLFSTYTDFFSQNKLGKDFFLTYRVPNPSVQKEQGKILLETLHSIPRAFDAARAAGSDIPPVFEVILPLTKNATELSNIRDYYEKIIIGQQDMKLGKSGMSVKKWVGDFSPDKINVIPLFEEFDTIVNCDKIVSEFMKGHKTEYQRVFLARSDPALNYGSVSAVLIAKIALMKLHNLENKLSTQILPIIGVGGAPFRGNFTPMNVNNCTDEYPSVQTYTIQSSFKYDYPFRDVSNAVDMLNHIHRRPALEIDIKDALYLANKIKDEYQKQLAEIADVINGLSAYVPNRRARKLHVGLFGYSRSLGTIKLPRAIKFCAAFYSIGIPPELLGLNALNEKDLDKLREMYGYVETDLKASLRFLNESNLEKLPKNVKTGIKKTLDLLSLDAEEENDEQYDKLTSAIYDDYFASKHTNLAEKIKAAAWKRKFLG